MFLGWILVALCATFALAADESIDHVFQANSENFELLLKGSEKVMVKFMAPSCGHCQNLKAAYSEAASRLLKYSHIKLAEVDATKDRVLTEKYEIQGFPTMKVFQNGGATVKEYQGGRSTENIVEYMLRQPLAVVQNLKDLEKIIADAAQEENTPVFVAFLDKGADDKWIGKIQDLSDDSTVRMAIATTNLAVDMRLKARHLSVLRNGNENMHQLPLTDETGAADVQKFLFIHSKDPLEKFDMDRASEYFASPIKYMTFIFANSPSDLKQFEDVAKKLQDLASHMTVVPSEMDKEALQGLYDFFQINENDLLFAVMIDTTEMKKYKSTSNVTPEQLLKWESEVVSGAIKQLFISGEPTDDDLKGNVIEVRGKTFEQLVLETPPNVLLYIFAPWCSHCEQFTPTYLKIGDTFANDDGIVIAKMDGTENEIESLRVQQFPTLIYYPVGKKTDPIMFPEGSEMSQDGIEEWVRQFAGKVEGDEL